MLTDVAQAVLGSLNPLPDKERQALAGTLRTWLACDGSTEATAEALSCHPSTVRSRLNRALQPLLRRATDGAAGDPVSSADGASSGLLTTARSSHGVGGHR